MEASRAPDSIQPHMQLAFITISDQEGIKDRVRQQHARTQAIRHVLQRKRERRRQIQQNFVEETPSTIARRRKKSARGDDEGDVIEVPRRSSALGASSVDPFETLAVNACQLTRLLRLKSSLQAGEPIFSVNNAVRHQELHSVFNAGFGDPALTMALYLTLAFAANDWQMNAECSRYQLQTIRHINDKLSDPAQAATTATIGTILLLVGVEYRLGDKVAAQIHLNGIQALLALCNQRKACLTHAMKRALFWQDLLTSIITGTQRVLSHDTFPEMHWDRQPFQETFHGIPPGFASRIDVLGKDFVSITGDINALHHFHEVNDVWPLTQEDVERVDNQQAWIESRLHDIRTSASSPLLICSCTAAYLCVYSIFDAVWNATLLPRNLSAQLLTQLQASESWEGWIDHLDLLLWLLNIGAAFAVNTNVRIGFAALQHGTYSAHLEPLSGSWNEVHQYLRTFIWSDIIYAPDHGAFWERIHGL